MKHLQKLRLLSLIFMGLLTFSCQHEDDFTGEKQAIEIGSSKLDSFKGLPVNHRFKSSIIELELDKSKIFKTVILEEKTAYYKSKGISFKGNFENEKLDMARLYRETGRVLRCFPYQENGVNAEMIRRDFPTLSDDRIGQNIELIDEYYSRNLNQEVARRYVLPERFEEDCGGSGSGGTTNIPIIPVVKKFKNEGESQKDCVLRLADIGFWSWRSKYALLLAQKKSEYYSTLKYPNLSTGDTKRDAYRHTLWSALLAKYYFTVSSKHPRLEFAKKIGDKNEDCGANTVDVREMDYHNNAIGRKIWDDNSSYKETWFGWTYGLNNPSLNHLVTRVTHQINNATFINKKEDFTGTPEEISGKVYLEIIKVANDKSVYISKETGNEGYNGDY
jgi:hypothetical protein